MEYLVGAAAVCAILYFRYSLRTHLKFEKYTLPNGHEYNYVLGDHVELYGVGSSFYGLSITLPKSFPQLYLDSQKGGGRLVRYSIDASQRLSLEGDFDTYFQLYAPKGSEALALSILTPDVMRELMSLAGKYDIEFYRNQLRIISNKLVYTHPARQAEMLSVVGKILPEIDQRLQSWPATDTPNEQQLLMYAVVGIRMFGQFVSWQMLVIDGFWILMTVLFLWMALLLFFYYHSPMGGSIMAAGSLVFLWALLRVTHYGLRRGAFRPKR